jgi:hypothetical protein
MFTGENNIFDRMRKFIDEQEQAAPQSQGLYLNGDLMVWWDEQCPLFGNRLVAVSVADAIKFGQTRAAEFGKYPSPEEALQDFLAVQWAWLAPIKRHQQHARIARQGKLPRLCFVKQGFAYFTEDMKTVWGDDWDDRPYEHNAGLPYDYCLKVGFDGYWSEPSDGCLNSEYSVREINSGVIPWLSGMAEDRSLVGIHAGATVMDFVRLIKMGGGTVYFPEYELPHK